MKRFITVFLTKLFGRQTVPSEHRANFAYLSIDTVWAGILNGTILAFLSVYAARIGATSQEIGLLSAAPAIAAILLTLPSGTWLKKRSITRAVFWTGMLFRGCYFVLFFLPLFLPQRAQVWGIILVTFFMSVPAVPFTVGFNTLFAEATPMEWRGHVAGIRNVCLSLATLFATLLSGVLLEKIRFPVGYQIVFLMGAIGATLSTICVGLIRPTSAIIEPDEMDGCPALEADPPMAANTFPIDLWKKISSSLHFEQFTGSFRIVILLLFTFHLFQYLPIPLFSVYQVKELHFNDQIISFGSAAFYVAMFLGSTQVARVTRKWGNQKVAAFGAMGLASYPGLMAFAKTPLLLVITNLAGGIAWALVGTASFNYLLEHVPAAERPSHLAWYNLALNTAILIGSLVGPAVAGVIGLKTALVIFAIGRVMAGVFFLIWG
jgi:MFS family permease